MNTDKTVVTDNQKSEKLPAKTIIKLYPIYLLAVIVLFCAPIIAFKGHPLSEQFIKASLLLLVVAISPLHKLRLLIFLAIGLPVALGLLVGHTYLMLQWFDFEGAEFDVVWAIPMILYVIFGSMGLQKLVYKQLV